MTISISVGIATGIGALLFYEGLKWAGRFFLSDLAGLALPFEGQELALLSQWTPPGVPWLVLPVICLGGLLSGLLVYFLAPEAEGSGMDAAISAFHGGSQMRARTPLLKAVTATLTISTGGSAGREGPMAQISAGLASIVADLLNFSTRERRVALATALGAGTATIFTAPLGGAILAAEILYMRDFESEAVVPAFLATIIGYAIFGMFEGFEPLFVTIAVSWELLHIPLFLLLGAVSALVGLLYIAVFFRTQDAFTRFFDVHRLPPYGKPVLGAFLAGLSVVGISLLAPEASYLGVANLGVGYGFVQLALYNLLPLWVIVLLPFTKILLTSLTVGSGGSGGVFAPGLVIGASTGGAMGMLFHLAAPGLVSLETVPAFVIVGMIALLGSVSKAPIAVMIMVIEMTGDFSLLIPAMGAVSISYLICGEETIFRSQVLNRARSPAHRGEYRVEVLQEIRTAEAMVPAGEVLSLGPDDRCETMLALVEQTSHTGFPVIENGRLIGIVSIGDVRGREDAVEIPVVEVMTDQLITIHPSDSLEHALSLMITHDIHHLPVVSPEHPEVLLGFLTRTDILKAYARAMAEEQERELFQPWW
ncbi:MAG: chloride channel protein [Methanomicrobiaceae archaeon]|nr:chloride channel protein [Methanomicrobiaceae archaeon]